MEGSVWNKDEIFKLLFFVKLVFNKYVYLSDIFDDVKYVFVF